MAVEREISSNMGLTIKEAVKEYISLQEYLHSEDWAFPVIEKIERRMKALCELVMEKTIDEMVK